MVSFGPSVRAIIFSISNSVLSHKKIIHKKRNLFGDKVIFEIQRSEFRTLIKNHSVSWRFASFFALKNGHCWFLFLGCLKNTVILIGSARLRFSWYFTRKLVQTLRFPALFPC